MKHRLKGGVGATLQRNYATLVTKRYGNSSTQLKVIAVVGNHGKTTTAYYLRDLLTENEKSTVVLESDGPLSVHHTQSFFHRMRKAGKEYIIVVLSPQDIRRHVQGSVPLEAVVVTDTSPENLSAVKLLLGTQPKYIVLNRDDEQYAELGEIEAAAQTICFGKHKEADAMMAKTKLYRKGSELRLVVDHQTELNLATYLVGEANLYSLAAAVTTLYVMGENIHQVDEGAARLESLPANYEYLEVNSPYDVVLDQASDEKILDAVVSVARSLTRRRLIVVTQADTVSPEAIEKIGGVADRLIVIDVNDETPNRGNVERVVSPDGAIKLALRTARQGDTVLLAGPVFARLEENGHSYAYVTIEHAQ